MTRTARSRSRTVVCDSARAVIVAVAILAAGTLAGCATTTPVTVTSQPAMPHEAPPPIPSVNPDDWPAVDVSGTGPQTITVPVPAPEARFLMAQFGCVSGQSTVTLLENPAVFEGGPCGGQQDITDQGGVGGYEMPLPAGVTTLHFQIAIDPGVDFRFSGHFCTSSC